MKTFIKFMLVVICTNLSYVVSAKPKGEFPASTHELTFISNESRMSGFIYTAKEAGPHPTVLLLHGYPGNEKNLDLAQALRAKGWNVVFFHYRGAWGSEGEFSFRNAEQDVQAVLHYLSDKNNSAKLRIDTSLISTVGHSMGGHMAISGILDNPSVKCSVSLDGANLGAKGVGFINDPSTEIPWKEYSDSLFMLNGWTGEKAVNETKVYANELDLVKRANKINGRSVMFIGANTDVIPQNLHITPLVNALKTTKDSDIRFKLIEDDHSFNNSREQLIMAVTTFLTSQCMNKS